MTRDQIERQSIAIERLSVTIFVALRCAGRPLTRGDIVKAFEPCGMRPTRGELSDAIAMLAACDKIKRELGPSGYYDFNDCTLKLV